MGQETNAAWIIGVQYLNAELTHVQAEIKLWDELLQVILSMETENMFTIESSKDANLFKSYKSALHALYAHRLRDSKRKKPKLLNRG